jgi:uncharacterized HhH-GPD family protein
VITSGPGETPAAAVHGLPARADADLTSTDAASDRADLDAVPGSLSVIISPGVSEPDVQIRGKVFGSFRAGVLPAGRRPAGERASLAGMGLMLSQQAEADALLDSDPLALVIGMVLDQQVPLEKAFTGPYELTRRLGHGLDARELAGYDTDELAAIFSKTPALHRFPASMAKRVQAMCQAVVDEYDGDVSNVWTTAADGAELRRRLGKLPGFGTQKAQIFLALLGKQYGVTPAGWREAAGEFGPAGSFRSVADITDQQSLARVREYKQQMKAAAKVKG